MDDTRRTTANSPATPADSRSGVTRDLGGRSVVAGLFATREQAETAVHALREAGFAGGHVGVALRDQGAAATPVPPAVQGNVVVNEGTHVAEGALSGVAGGGLLGGLLGFLVGVGALAVPGVGPVIAGGALASIFGFAGGTALAGAGLGAAAGGIVGALIGMGIPEDEARYFESGFRSGGVLVTVQDPSRAAEAVAILERYGADTGQTAARA